MFDAAKDEEVNGEACFEEMSKMLQFLYRV